MLPSHATPIQGGSPHGDDRPLNLGHPDYVHEWHPYEQQQIQQARRIEKIQRAYERGARPDTTVMETMTTRVMESTSIQTTHTSDDDVQQSYAGVALPTPSSLLTASLGLILPISSTNIRLTRDVTRGTVIERTYDTQHKSSYVVMTTSALTTSYTKSLWIRVYDTFGYPHLMGSASGDASTVGVASHYLYLWGGRLIGGHAVAGRRYQILDPTPITIYTWIHVVLTYDVTTSNLMLYRDGRMVAQGVAPRGWTSGQATTLGNQDGIYGLNGCIDRAQLYNQALSAVQVQQLYMNERDMTSISTTTSRPTQVATQQPTQASSTKAPTQSPATKAPTVAPTTRTPTTRVPTQPATPAPTQPATQTPTTSSYRPPVIPTGAVMGTSAQQILYHGGQVMLGALRVYIIYYGGWAANDPIFTLVPQFIADLDGSSYWNIQTTYPQTIRGIVSRPTNRLTWGTHSIERGTESDSYSTIISDSNIYQLIQKHIMNKKLPYDAQGLYLVMTAPDVAIQSGFCTSYCGWHTSATASNIASTGRIRYGLVGSGIRCPSSCLPNINPTISPNNNRNADGMLSILAHEMAEMITDPDLSAWLDTASFENADKCAWNFGRSMQQVYTTRNGANANLRLNGREYLIQTNWVNHQTGYCAMST